MGLNILKCLAELLTAVFGVLGTFKDFSKDKESVRWKYINIAGIVLSASVALTVQNVEYRQHMREDRDRDGQFKATSSQLSAISTNLTTSVSQATDLQTRLQESLTIQRQSAQAENKISQDAQLIRLSQVPIRNIGIWLYWPDDHDPYDTLHGICPENLKRAEITGEGVWEGESDASLATPIYCEERNGRGVGPLENWFRLLRSSSRKPWSVRRLDKRPRRFHRHVVPNTEMAPDCSRRRIQWRFRPNYKECSSIVADA